MNGQIDPYVSTDDSAQAGGQQTLCEVSLGIISRVEEMKDSTRTTNGRMAIGRDSRKLLHTYWVRTSRHFNLVIRNLSHRLHDLSLPALSAGG